jgi:hypothetical protein
VYECKYHVVWLPKYRYRVITGAFRTCVIHTIQLLPRPTLDLQFIAARKGDDLPEIRWIDRYVSEDNIINTWRQLVAQYLFFMPKPFQGIDPYTLARQDTPPSYRVFREAAINLLIPSYGKMISIMRLSGNSGGASLKE